MSSDPTYAEVLVRIRWTRMCMALLLLQDDLRISREIASATPRKALRW